MSATRQASLITKHLSIATKAAVPRGTRRRQRPGWTSKLQRMYTNVSDLFSVAQVTNTAADWSAATAADEELAAACTKINEARLPRRVQNVASGTDAWRVLQDLSPHPPAQSSFTHSTTSTDEDGNSKKVLSEITDAKEQGKILGEMFAHLCRIRNSNNSKCPALPPRTEADWAACLVTHSETRAALDELIPKSSCGPDGVSARILHEARLVPAFIHAVSRLFSAILWQSGLPLLWLKVEITAIVKAQKDGKESKHYRPIGLSVNLCKALEWIVTKRTQPHLPTMPHQYGFTEHKSSEQVLTTITADITTALDSEFDQVGPGRSNSGRAMVLFVDAAAAYLSVNPNKFIQLLIDNDVPAYLIRFFHAFLSNRSQRVTWKGWRDEWRKTPWGGAQGLKSMSEIWKIFFSDLIDKFPRVTAFFDKDRPQSQASTSTRSLRRLPSSAWMSLDELGHQ